MTSCRQLSGRFQFRSSLSGSTTGTVSSSKNSTGNWGCGTASVGSGRGQLERGCGKSSSILECPVHPGPFSGSTSSSVPRLEVRPPHLTYVMWG
ncbi:hypothetical protein I79_019214 [Cricetulus griseus]|uniref:Uncharacterized protein n=1 Tax=Cricetulus griseus TaxID=10029 RepID=G3I6T6_CRIGR|nr:hypothetical protein I79_019214 [Cricetulus griseus]